MIDTPIFKGLAGILFVTRAPNITAGAKPAAIQLPRTKSMSSSLKNTLPSVEATAIGT
jgi:hypothetical protein